MSSKDTNDFRQTLQSPVRAHQEGLEFFMGKGILDETIRRITAELEGMGIAYSVTDALALNQHGYRRFTEDINLLTTPEGLNRFREELVELGYRPAFQGAARKLRTVAENVPLEIITSGEYPGDGLPKPIQFHDPEQDCVVIDGIKTVTLKKLIELKLASGISAPTA